eukprot:1156288-Pelagomonas_calceolata.AAC.3
MVAKASDWLSILTTGVGCLTSTEDAQTLQARHADGNMHICVECWAKLGCGQGKTSMGVRG